MSSNLTESLTRLASSCLAAWRHACFIVYGTIFLTVKCQIPYMLTKIKKLEIQDIPRGEGNVAVITGGAAGIGYEVVKKLLKADFHVILGVRNLERGKQTREKIRKDGITSGRLEYFELELASLNSVRRFAKLVLARTNRIHILINNAGIMMVPYAVTEDNMESHFQVNYLSHFLLTNLLLPTMIQTGEDSDRCSRIINVSSAAQLLGIIDFDNLQGRKLYTPHEAYFRSKLAQVLSTKYLDGRMVEASNNVRIYSVHPGMIATGLWANSTVLKIIGALAARVLQSEEEGADRILYAAVSPALENKGGLFLWDNKDCRESIQAENVDEQERLWQISLALVGLNHNSY